MVQGLSEGRVKRLRQELGIDRRTLKRWREWWMRIFVQSVFWRAERGRFRRRVVEEKLPLGLVRVFGASQREGLLNLMKFLSPISTNSCKEVMVM